MKQPAAKPQRVIPPAIPCLGAEDFAGMRRAGIVCASILDAVQDFIEVGVRTVELDLAIENLVHNAGAISATKGYRGYRHSSCISVNDQVCHGIPGVRRLEAGDILNIDVTVIYDGWHGDSSRMFFVGPVSKVARELCQTTFEAMWRGIRAAGPGRTLGDVGHAVQSFAEAKGYSIVRSYCGHGIGRSFHQPPKVLHTGQPGKGLLLKPGMCFTVEPILNTGAAHTNVSRDGWTVSTVDGGLSAQFEHTIGITEDGVEAFTLSPLGSHHPYWPGE